MRLYRPRLSVVLMSIILAGLGVAGVVHYIPFVTDVSFWLLLARYIVLMLGVLADGV